ncbi:MULTISPECIES: fumarylacetoacetate hydrolase family protein [unclassified Achromobacter]|uniref:fumarylacetoacetate hydrolase family protein n=1 Tax=unclassified Achromobacter TaxID=2626865 RepID=UPI000B51724D|nr:MULTISPECIES: fumarylacetoacetate hydrolase family protein [unclassified Achromobacter]OWT71436.1 fumarylacetoacetate hydrolase [Achromobacter sp. HZ34]OWT73093.1 fumarylacetoacetate hydrolase [Achromobacter sp. HZ28]
MQILTPENTLPTDGDAGTLVGRAWVPGKIGGPSPVVLRAGGVYDLSTTFATLSDLLDAADPVQAVRRAEGRLIGSSAEVLANTRTDADAAQAHFLAPADLQVIKAAGVTFASSMIERVIEEQAKGEPARAEGVRRTVVDAIGTDLRAVKPGSPEAAHLKSVLMAQGLWSQYLEVGIGPDAEVFTKAPVLSAVGTGNQIGIHPKSEWNNPEPEIVLAVTRQGTIVGATLGNDVNLRDFEGRSALLLSKAKDNNASCAIGPFIRLFDDTFSLDDVRRCELTLRVEGTDGYVLSGASSMAQISRDPLDLVAQTLNRNHQYPDGFLLFLGTLFAPTEDRDHPGGGFTHKVGDVVSIATPRLGALRNAVTHSDNAPPWNFGLGQLMRNLASRGLLSAR